jgi:hypothetical protein
MAFGIGEGIHYLEDCLIIGEGHRFGKTIKGCLNIHYERRYTQN